MAQSPLLNKKTDLVTTEVLVGGSLLDGEARVTSVTVTKEVNRIARAYIQVLDGNLSKQEFKLQDNDTFEIGKEVEIKIGYHQDTNTIFKGIVNKTGIKIVHGQHSIIYAECCDKSIVLTTERRNKYHHDKKDSDVINDLAGEAGLATSIDNTAITHKELVQYYSTDWDFIVSRAEVNGLIVFTDDNKLCAEKPKTSDDKVKLEFGTDIIKTDLNFDGSSQIQEVNTKSWAFSKQDIDEKLSSEPGYNQQGSIDPKAVASDFNTKPFEFHHSGPIEKAELKEWASAKLLKSRLSRIRGTVTIQGNHEPKPNTTFDLKKIGKYFEGTGFISGVEHEIKAGNWITKLKIGLESEWFSETKTMVNSAPAAGMLPGISGLYIGIVKDIHQDPEGEFRVQVDLPMVEKSGDGIWARLGQGYASEDFGLVCFPQVGDEVVLGFIQGDPRFPIIIGSLYSSQRSPKYPPDSDNSVQAFTSKNGLELIFEDKDKNIVLVTPGGHKICMSDKDSEVTVEDSNRNKITLDSNGVKISSCRDVIIEAASMGKVDITGGSGGVKISSSTGAIDLSGMQFKVKGSASTTIEGAMTTLKGTGKCTISGAVVMIN